MISKQLLLWLFMSTTFLFAQENIEDKIMKYCKGRWGTDSSMVEYEYKKQTEALIELQEFKNKSKEMNAEKEIENMIRRASSKYWEEEYGISDFPMVVHECIKQFTAVIKISDYYGKYGSGAVELNILNNAVGKWHVPDFDTYDYIMIVHEFEKQLESFHKMVEEDELNE